MGIGILDVLTFQVGFNTTVVIIGSTFLGIATGLVGCFAVLRKRALLGDALAHAALPGVCLAYIIGVIFSLQARSLFLLSSGALCSGLLGVLVVHFLSKSSRLSEDSAMGAVLSVFFGFGVVLLSIIQTMNTGSEGGVHSFIYGQTAAMHQSDAIVTACTAVVLLVITLLFFKELRVLCFDREFATVQGLPVGFLDLLLMSLIVIITTVGLQIVGLLLIVALLIIPPAAARFWSERFSVVCGLSAIFGGMSSYIGSSISALAPRLPTGALIVLVSGVIFCGSLFFSPGRGVLARGFALARLRLRIAREHMLRSLYEKYESSGVDSLEAFQVSVHSVSVLSRWPFLLRELLFLRLVNRGALVKDGNIIGLTKEGLVEAASLTRAHRLWEQYIVTYGSIASSHVDYSADLVEHFLSPELVAKLEEELIKEGRGVVSEELPKSIHHLGVCPS